MMPHIQETVLQIRKTYAQKRNLFFLFFLLFLTVSAVSVIFGDCKIESMLFKNCDDFFADTFNIYNCLKSENVYAGDSFYTKGYYGFYIARYIRNYPPMAYIHFDILRHLLHFRNTHLFLAVYVSVLLALPFFYLLYKKLCLPEIQKVAFCVCILFSSVYISSLERGNIIMAVILYVTIFLFHHDSKNPFLRELSLISLALAASVKVYPAIFGLILIYEKQWRQCLRLYIYGVLFSFLPFLYFPGGFHLIPDMLFNVFSPYSIRHPACLLFSAWVPLIRKILPALSADTIQHFLHTFGMIVSILACITAFFDNRYWRKSMFIAVSLLLAPKVGGGYNFLYIVPCIVLFLNDSAEDTSSRIISVLLALIFAPFIIIPNRYTNLMFLKGLSVDLLVILLFYSSVKEYLLRRRKTDIPAAQEKETA